MSCDQKKCKMAKNCLRCDSQTLPKRSGCLQKTMIPICYHVLLVPWRVSLARHSRENTIISKKQPSKVADNLVLNLICDSLAFSDVYIQNVDFHYVHMKDILIQSCEYLFTCASSIHVRVTCVKL